MKHSIRLACNEDIPLLLSLLQEFYAKTSYPSELFAFDEESMKEMLQNLIKAKTILTDGQYGVFGFLLAPLYINKAILIAQEIFWWVTPSYRGAGLGLDLFDAAESLARWHSAACLVIATSIELNSDKMDKLYTLRGYTKKEQHYIGRL